MTEVRQKFIILRKIKYAEADLIIHALSPTGGKVSFIARGALRSKKRFGGGILEPSHFVMLTYKEAAEIGQLNVLQEATLINGFESLRKDYDRLEVALQILDCAAKASQEGDTTSEFLFNLVGHALKALEGSTDVLVLKTQFYLKFFLQQGVIQAEPWMGPFLKMTMADNQQLLPYRDTVDEQLPILEDMMAHYLKNATL